MFTIAKDVKIQIEFNPQNVKAYRLIGYENRVMADKDFNDDTKDAGELGPGHTVTALYEIIPANGNSSGSHVDPLKYQKSKAVKDFSAELLTLKFRYKPIDSDQSIKIVTEVYSDGRSPNQTSNAFRFSAAVAGFGMLLRESKYIYDFSFEDVITLAKGATGSDEREYRSDFIDLVEIALEIKELTQN